MPIFTTEYLLRRNDMSLHLIAIVGRPNVGKSTLFNRIIERREAIVESQPGVTRDRHYAKAEWAGKHFMLIDTGGIVPNSEEVFDVVIKEQAFLAVEEADAIIFVCDARDGITETDKEIAHILRRSTKPITVVINKCDNSKLDELSYEFYELGFENVFAISALSGRNTGDFLDHATETFDGTEEVEDERLKIALVGRPNVGKSSLTNVLLGKNRAIVTDIPGTTRDSTDSVVKYYGEEIILIDTAGLRRKSHVVETVEYYSTIRTTRAIERSDVVIVVLDAERGLEHQDKRIITQVIDARKGIIIAVNKWDLIEKDEKTAENFRDKIYEELRTYDYAPVVFISAVTKQRTTKLIEMSKEIQEKRATRIRTATLNEKLLQHLDNTPPPAVRGRDLRINFVTQVKSEPPVFAFFCNYPEDIPDSYKRFIERSLRKEFDLVGVPISFIFRKKNKERD